jgi:endonuclease/exonuclease/phosphatase family metal-dependent hydrolase
MTACIELPCAARVDRTGDWPSLCAHLLSLPRAALRELSFVGTTFRESNDIAVAQCTTEASVRRNSLRRRDFARGLHANAVNLGTYNLNRINGSLLRNKSYARSRPILEAALNRDLRAENTRDVLAFQELWTWEDHEMIRRIAEANGFQTVFTDKELLLETGLQIIVRKGIETMAPRFYPYLSRREPIRTLWESASGVMRGLMTVVMRLPNGARVLITNTHLTPMTWHHQARKAEMQAQAQILQYLRPSVDLTLSLGDYNITSDYRGGSLNEASAMHRLKVQYEALFTDIGFVDAFRAVNEPSIRGFTTIANFPPPSVFGGFPAANRVDYIFLLESEPQSDRDRYLAYVAESNLQFTERLSATGEPDPRGEFASDHALLQAKIMVFIDSSSAPLR